MTGTPLTKPAAVIKKSPKSITTPNISTKKPRMTSRRQRKKRMSRMPRRKAAVPRFFCGERAKKKVMVEEMEVVRGRPMRNRICR